MVRLRAEGHHGEAGFILITATWMLVLCGAIVAALMLRATHNVRTSVEAEQTLRERLALESAVQTVTAEILFNGPQSRWGRTPAQGSVALGDRTVAVDVSSEAGKLDLNDGDPQLIDTALRGAGVAAAAREAFLTRLMADREAGKRIASWPDLQVRLAPLGLKCADRWMTIYSGLSNPSSEQMPVELARLLKFLNTDPNMPTPPAPGTALRMTAAIPGHNGITAIVRITALVSTPISIIGWQASKACN